MTIRRWKYEDILRISQLEEECFPEEPWSFSTLAQTFASPAFLGVVAEDGGEIIGYGGITSACESADIENIAVTEAYRQSGVGTSILNELCALAKSKGVEKMFLEVRVSNVSAMRMYLKCGFVGLYARRRYYANGEDCLVMTKNFKEN